MSVPVVNGPDPECNFYTPAHPIAQVCEWQKPSSIYPFPLALPMTSAQHPPDAIEHDSRVYHWCLVLRTGIQMTCSKWTVLFSLFLIFMARSENQQRHMTQKMIICVISWFVIISLSAIVSQWTQLHNYNYLVYLFFHGMIDSIRLSKNVLYHYVFMQTQNKCLKYFLYKNVETPIHKTIQPQFATTQLLALSIFTSLRAYRAKLIRHNEVLNDPLTPFPTTRFLFCFHDY